MATTNSELVVRECAFDIIRIAGQHKDDSAKMVKALEAPLLQAGRNDLRAS